MTRQSYENENNWAQKATATPAAASSEKPDPTKKGGPRKIFNRVVLPILLVSTAFGIAKYVANNRVEEARQEPKPGPGQTEVIYTGKDGQEFKLTVPKYAEPEDKIKPQDLRDAIVYVNSGEKTKQGEALVEKIAEVLRHAPSPIVVGDKETKEKVIFYHKGGYGYTNGTIPTLMGYTDAKGERSLGQQMYGENDAGASKRIEARNIRDSNKPMPKGLEHLDTRVKKDPVATKSNTSQGSKFHSAPSKSHAQQQQQASGSSQQASAPAEKKYSPPPPQPKSADEVFLDQVTKQQGKSIKTLRQP